MLLPISTCRGFKEQGCIPHDSGQTSPQLEVLEICDVLLEQVVHLLLVLLEGREPGEVVLGNHSLHLGLAELDDALAQISQVLEQIVVVGIDKFPLKKSVYQTGLSGCTGADSLPLKFGIAGLRASREQVVSPDIGVDAGIPSVVSEDTNTVRLAELAALIVEVLGGGHVLDLGPVFPGADLRGRENDGVEA